MDMVLSVPVTMCSVRIFLDWSPRAITRISFVGLCTVPFSQGAGRHALLETFSEFNMSLLQKIVVWINVGEARSQRRIDFSIGSKFIGMLEDF